MSNVDVRGRMLNWLLSNIRRSSYVALLVVVASSISLAACGTDPSSNTAAKILPHDTRAFVTAALSPSIEQKAALFRLSQRVPLDERPKNKDSVGGDLVNELVEHWDLDYERDLAPWLGGEVAAALLPPRTGGETPLAVALLKCRDEGKASATLEAKGISPHSYRFIGDYLVIVDKNEINADDVAGAFDAMKAVERGEAESLNDKERYREMIGATHDQHLARGWLDLPAVLESKEGADGDDDSTSSLTSLGNSLGAITFSFYATDSALVLDAASEHEIDHHATTSGELLDRLPDDTMGAIDVSDIRDFLKTQTESIGSAGGSAQGQGDLTNNADALFETLDGETVVIANKTDDLFGFGLSAAGKTSDPTAATSAIEGMARAFEQISSTRYQREAIEGGVLYRAQQAPTDSYGPAMVQQLPALAVSGDTVVVAYDAVRARTLIEKLRGPAGPSRVKTTEDRLVVGQGFVDPMPLIEQALSGRLSLLSPSDDAEQSDTQQAEEWARSLGDLSGQAWNDGKRARLELRLDFE